MPPWIKSWGGRRQGPRDPFATLSSTLPPLGERGSVSGSVVPLRNQSQPRAGAEDEAQMFGPVTTADQARTRRRNVLISLAATALFTLVLAVMLGGFFIALNLLFDVALLGYVVLLVRHQQATQGRINKVRPIRPVQHNQPQNYQYQQRSAN